MSWMSKIVFAFSISFAFSGESLASRYQLYIDSSSPATGAIRLILKAPLSSDTLLVTRQLAASNVEKPVCVTSGKALIHQNGEWVAPAGCAEIAWNVKFSNPATLGYDVSQQGNLYHAGKWWLFTEWGDLLRLPSNTSESEICTKGHIEICRRVPSSNEAPLLLLIGLPDKQLVYGDTSFNFFTGHLPKDFDVKDLYRSYDRQLSYIHGVMAAVNNAPLPQNVDALVLGIDSSLGVIGGAAGSGAYLANISVHEEGVSTSERVRHLWVAAHEMAHMLGLGTGALWASESLAHYYGFKSLGENRHASQLFEKMVGEMEPIGLLKAHQLVAEGEGQHYAQFYVKGAAFWQDVDQALVESTQGKKSLDNYLSLLINGKFGVNGELPAEFKKVMVDVIGQEKTDRLYRDYL